MDGKRFKPDSEFLHSKCTLRLYGGDDRISQLPDDIKVAILSLLPLKNAAATSVLSSRWLSLWKHTPNLNFGRNILKLDSHTRLEMHKIRSRGSLWDVERCKYVELVNSVIQSHKCPSLKQFNISFYVNKSGMFQVTKWLEFVFLRGVERLELVFHCSDPEYMVVLEELLRESVLSWRPQTLILFKSLKRMCLKYLKVRGEDIELFLCNCPLLEEMIIAVAFFTSDVEVCSSTYHPVMLKHLEVYANDGEKSVRVSAPNLTWLSVDDSSEKLLLENVPKLVGADFRFRTASPSAVKNLASALFCFSSQLKNLKLTLSYPKVFMANWWSPKMKMPNLNKLVVEYYGVKTHSLLPVTALIWASPRLQKFKIEFMNIRNGQAACMELAKRCEHRHLKVFEFAGLLGGASGHIELVTYILDHCAALEEIIISCGPSNPFFPDIAVFGKASEIKNEKPVAMDYAKQQLEGRVPQHIQLRLV